MHPIDAEEINYPWSVHKSTKDPDNLVQPLYPKVKLNWKTKFGLDPKTKKIVNMQYSDDQAEGAIPNGTRVRKRRSEEGDNVPDGSKGKIIGSFKTPPLGPGKISEMQSESKLMSEYGIPEYGIPEYGYFVEWEDLPGMIIGTTSIKVERDE